MTEESSANNVLLCPPSLKKGDKIGIISTARKISKEEIVPAIAKFEEWGLDPILGKHLFSEHHQFAGTDEQRTEDLQEMINNPEIKAIICARGGYGTVRIIDNINFDPIFSRPKWIVGYSDVTVLHSHLNRIGVQSLHATMPINFPKDGVDNESLKSLYSALFFNKIKYDFNAEIVNEFKQIEGELVGGNLSILYSLNGSKSDIQTIDKIIFFEDLDEYLYHVDRMIMGLKRAGKFSHNKGILIGGLTDMRDNQIPFGYTARQIVKEQLKEMEIPIIFDFPAGHQIMNKAIFLGRNARITHNNQTITFEQ